MSPYWTVQLPRPVPVHLSGPARPGRGRLVFSYRGLQAVAQHVAIRRRRRPFISSNGARLFDDTTAASSHPQRGGRTGVPSTSVYTQPFPLSITFPFSPPFPSHSFPPARINPAMVWMSAVSSSPDIGGARTTNQGCVVWSQSLPFEADSDSRYVNLLLDCILSFSTLLLVRYCTLLCTFYYKNFDFFSIHPETHNQYMITRDVLESESHKK